uniref:(northern house mosquito) hypothetical protein n=1 Tax=Culex pipiens TaxID=7175 RepID=A0A8D8P2K0_CULPI
MPQSASFTLKHSGMGSSTIGSSVVGAGAWKHTAPEDLTQANDTTSKLLLPPQLFEVSLDFSHLMYLLQFFISGNLVPSFCPLQTLVLVFSFEDDGLAQTVATRANRTANFNEDFILNSCLIRFKRITDLLITS